MRKKIAIVCGGDSGEYEISISSGKVVYKSLDQQKYQPYLIIIKG
ncbi:MAG: D-alanine--D-alanine ligase, partial [Ignavibacteria bacterium]|nr:D-alanine--D-alanine ligase [Ignavibacteria bacterium]